MAVDAEWFSTPGGTATRRRTFAQRQRRRPAQGADAVLLADTGVFYVTGNTVTPVTVGRAIARFRVAARAVSPAPEPAAAAPASSLTPLR